MAASPPATIRGLLASALGPLGGFAAIAADFVAEYTDEREGDAYLRGDWVCLSRPTAWAAANGDLRLLQWVFDEAEGVDGTEGWPAVGVRGGERL